MKNAYGILKKSDRAIQAESFGLLTYSRLSAWQKRAVACGAVRPREWHHTGAAASRTDYYDPYDFEDLDPKDYPPEKIEKAKQADLKRLKITITYQEMVGGFTTRRKKFETVTVEGLDVRKKDGAITGAKGRRLSSRNDKVIFSYLPPRCRKWREITQEEAEAIGYTFA